MAQIMSMVASYSGLHEEGEVENINYVSVSLVLTAKFEVQQNFETLLPPTCHMALHLHVYRTITCSLAFD